MLAVCVCVCVFVHPVANSKGFFSMHILQDRRGHGAFAPGHANEATELRWMEV